MDKVHAARVLLVGAGGIGCEVLKNLVLVGVRTVEVIDLDTIDVSNLNRQFLFRPHHVGRPKALVACEVASSFNPAAAITAYHANIKERRFGVDYFRRFGVVINALDNVSARKHVNRLCLAAGVPLVEAGTQGYLGQASVIAKGVTECFECTAQTTQKRFPICTIRSTPDRPVHCVVWARELHKLLFGDARTSYLYEDERLAAGGSGAAGGGESGGGAEGGGAEGGGESVYMAVVTAAPRDAAAAADAAGVARWARRLFGAVFHDEIVKRLAIAPDTYKTAAVQPRPLGLEAIEAGRQGGDGDSSSASGGAAAAAGATSRLRDQVVLTLRESAALLLAALARYYTDPAVAPGVGSLEFSKDSDLDLDFVTAATNLRAYTFGIPMQSRFDVKSIAGNIIPAIATTNAIVAGLQVLEVVKILRGDDIGAACANTWVARAAVGGNKLLLATRHAAPKPSCYVCSKRGATVFIDTAATTLRAFIDKVLVGALAFNTPNIDNGDGFNFLEEREDGESADEYRQKLAFLAVPMAALVGGGLRHGTVAEITDFSQDLSVTLSIAHRANADFDELKHPAFFELVGDDAAAATAARLDAELAAKTAAPAPPAAAAPAAPAAPAAAAAAAAAPLPAAGHKRDRGADDAIVEVDSDGDGSNAAKRVRGADGASVAAPAPAPAPVPAPDDDCIVVDD